MKNTKVDAAALSLMKHDIKNQLSNIHLAIATIQYEVTNPTEDFTFCLDAIIKSTAKIDTLLNPLD